MPNNFSFKRFGSRGLALSRLTRTPRGARVSLSSAARVCFIFISIIAGQGSGRPARHSEFCFPLRLGVWVTCRAVSLRDTARGGVREYSPPHTRCSYRYMYSARVHDKIHTRRILAQEKQLQCDHIFVFAECECGCANKGSQAHYKTHACTALCT